MPAKSPGHRPWIDAERISAENHEARLDALFRPRWGSNQFDEPEAAGAPLRAWKGRGVLTQTRGPLKKSQKQSEGTS